MQKNEDKVTNSVSDKTKSANLKLAIILGLFVLFGMTSTIFMLTDKI